MSTLTVVFHPAALDVQFTPPALGVSTGTPIARSFTDRDPYEGAYAVTPSAQAQTLSTRNLRMTDDVTIAPIPSNYGLITWDGSTLTVS